jgi:hypothetical protein
MSNVPMIETEPNKKRSKKVETAAPAASNPQWNAIVQQERLAHHLGNLVAQAETQAAAEREEERAERRDQQAQMLQAVRELTGAVRSMAQSNGQVREQMETLQSEVKTLRAAILLAHSIGREENGQAPLGLDVAKGTPFDPFQVPEPFAVPAAAPEALAAGSRPKRTHAISDEARAKISAAQKARWEEFRRNKNQ